MEARLSRAALVAAAACCFLGAGHRTQNFIATAPTQELAVEIGETAEKYRRELAIEWLGAELPAWSGPCPITAQVGQHLGAGGATSFMFERGRPFGWTMTIQGSRERILDSVLPHEVTHTIFATHFGRPLPRWADEGACTTVEHASERNKQQEMLITFLTSNRGIAFNKMFAMKDYPHDVMPLYSQGYSLVRYLIGHGGKQKFVKYVGDGMNANNWTAATAKHYGYKSLSELQVTWLDWVRQGSQDVKLNERLAAAETPAPRDVVRIGTAEIDNMPLYGVKSPADNRRLVPVTPVSDSGRREPATPAPSDIASRATGPGWYAKQRDIAQANRPAQEETRGGKIDIYQPQVVTRPQPIGRPQQTILEWSRPPAPSSPLLYGRP